MDVSKIYCDLEADAPPQPYLKAGGAFALRTGLLLLAEFEAMPLFTLSYEGTQLADRYPAHAIPMQCRAVFKGEVTRYNAWRRALLDLQFLSTDHAVDADPIVGLQRLARLEIGAWAANPFYLLLKVLPAGMGPCDLDDKTAMDLNAQLSGHEQRTFRMAVSLMARLQGSELAAERGILPKTVIGVPPLEMDPRRSTALPAALEDAYQRAPASVRPAISLVYRLVRHMNLLPISDETSVEDLLTDETEPALYELDPSDLGYRKPSQETLRTYLRTLNRFLGCRGTGKRLRADPVQTAWSELRQALVDRGMLAVARRTFAVSRIATDQRMTPADLSPQWIAATLEALPKSQVNPFRTGIFALDEAIGCEARKRTLLPDRISGLTDRRSSSRKTDSQVCWKAVEPINAFWADFTAALRASGFTRTDLSAVSAVRASAVDAGVSPENVDRNFLLRQLEGSAHRRRARIHAAARVFDRAHGVPELKPFRSGPPLGPLPDGRTTHCALPDAIAQELDDLMVEIGYGESTKRGMRVALKALLHECETRGLGPFADIGELLQQDLNASSSVNATPQQIDRYRRSLMSLRDFTTLPWTLDWRSLYAAAREAGCPPARNPVPTLMTYADGRSPWEMDDRWVLKVETCLRRPAEGAKHGRADLAKTFLVNVRRLEGLRDCPEFGGAHLLSGARLIA